MPLANFSWKVWAERLLNVAVIVVLAMVLGKYFLPVAGEAVTGESAPFLASGQPVLLEFSQTHCPSCVVLKPVVDGIRRDYEGRALVRVYQLDRLQDYPEGEAVRALGARLGVRGTPTFVILDREGNAVRRFAGPTSGGSLRKALDQALEATPGS